MYQSAKEKANRLLVKSNATVVAVGSALTVVAGQASAALPASVGTTFTGIQDDMQAVFDLAFPAVVLGLGLVIVIKLVKRFGSKI